MAQQQTSKKSHLHTGDTFRCQKCGMEVEVKQECDCDNCKPRMECCGQPLTKA